MKIGDWLGLFSTLTSLVILWQFRQIVLLIFTAVVLATALNALVRRLQRFQIKRAWAMLMALGIVTLGGILFVSLVLPPFLSQFEQLIQLVPIGVEAFLKWLETIIESPPDWLPLDDLQFEMPSLTDLTTQVTPLAQQLLGNFVSFFSDSVTNVLQLLLVLVLAIMFAADPLSYRKLAVRLFPSFYRRRADSIFSACETSLLSWMGGIAFNSLFIASFSAAGLIFLQIPFVFAHALLAGVFNFIPNIGPAASAVFPISVALLDNPWKALGVIVWYIIIQNLESYWFSPMVMQKQVSLLPAATLVAQIFFATFLGLPGLILALPLAVTAKTWIEKMLIEDVLDRWSPIADRFDKGAVAELVGDAGTAAIALENAPSQTEREAPQERYLNGIARESTLSSDSPEASSEPVLRDGSEQKD